MHRKVKSLILQKQKSTLAIALSIANDKHLSDNILMGSISKKYYEKLIQKFRENTLYKNIWIHILDKDATSLYRSWSDKKGDNVLNNRDDLKKVLLSKNAIYSVSLDLYDLTIKAIVPIINNNQFIGIVEVISHFNFISRNLKQFDIDSIVVTKKEFTKQLINPFTKLFINDYYIANFDAPKELMTYLKKHGIENYFNDLYRVENGYIIYSHELLDIQNNVIAYFIMFKKLDNISSVDLDFFMFKWIMIGITILMSMIIIVSIVLFYIYRRDKLYYQNIIDTSNNIIMVVDEKEIKEVNATFFKYFFMYKSLEQFKLKHKCICDFFINKDSYLKKEYKGISWIAYMISNSNENYKIALKIDNKDYYFSASASVIKDREGYIAIIMSDITKQENYKNELVHISVTDALTSIGNRRYFQQKIIEEISRTKRYEQDLSLIICDIDYFKEVNDKYGHNVGDEVLIEYTKLISLKLRESDVFCRIGGEEFIIILPHTKRPNAIKIAEKIRIDIESTKKVVPITMSFGVVEYVQGEDNESIFKRADKALYKAKESGRNKVIAG